MDVSQKYIVFGQLSRGVCSSTPITCLIGNIERKKSLWNSLSSVTPLTSHRRNGLPTVNGQAVKIILHVMFLVDEQ